MFQHLTDPLFPNDANLLNSHSYLKNSTNLFLHPYISLFDSAFPFSISHSVFLFNKSCLPLPSRPPDHCSPFLLAKIHQSFTSLLFLQWFTLSCPRHPTLFCGYHDCYLQFCPLLKPFISLPSHLSPESCLLEITT